MNDKPMGLLEASENYTRLLKALKTLKDYLPTIMDLSIDKDLPRDIHLCIFCGEFYPQDKEIIHLPGCPGKDLMELL